MNSLLDDKTLMEIMAHYPEELRRLLNQQINGMINLIIDHRERYLNDGGFRDALDLVLVQVVNGTFLPEGDEHERDR